jgi:hypothetical protein
MPPRQGAGGAATRQRGQSLHGEAIPADCLQVRRESRQTGVVVMT